MALRLDKPKSDEFFFFVAYSLFLTFTILSTSLYYRYLHGKPFQLMYVVCAGLLFLQELQYVLDSRRELVGLIVAGALFSIAFLVADGALQRSIACIFMFCYCARRIPFQKIARFTLWFSGALVLLILVSAWTGVIENHQAVQYVNGRKRVREYLGFRYALFPAAHLLNMTSLWIYLKKDRLPVTGAVLWGLLNYWVYVRTDSRTSFVIALFLLTAALLLRFLPRVLDKLQPLNWLMALSFPICAGISICLTMGYDKTVPWMAKLNSSLSDRLSLGLRSLDTYGFKLLWQEIEWVGNDLNAFGQPTVGSYNYVDCLYVKVLQRYGVIFLVLFLLLVTLALIRALRRRDYHLLILMTTIAAHCMLDDLSLYLHYNTFWLALGALLLNPQMLDSEETKVPLRRKKRKRLSVHWI